MKCIINGNRVGDDYYNPGLTQYNITHMYQTYDVTRLLNKGENAIGAMLGEGWWSGLSELSEISGTISATGSHFLQNS